MINEKNEIILGNKSESSTKEKEETIYYEVIKCKHCGATNKVYPGVHNKCQYCNSILPMPETLLQKNTRI